VIGAPLTIGTCLSTLLLVANDATTINARIARSIVLLRSGSEKLQVGREYPTMEPMLRMLKHIAGGREPSDVAVTELVIAGWTGRDTAGLQHHIDELKALGVKPPSSVPLFYRVDHDLLTIDNTIDVVGPETSGEVETVIVSSGGLWVGLGSDHTDRAAEAYSVALSKQLCRKVIAPELWRLEDVAPHWDRLILRAHAVVDGKRRLYQEGATAVIRDPRELMERFTGRGPTLPDGTVMFCGTQPAIGGIAPADRFEMELEDPVLGRSLRAAYDIRALPLVV
jgi:hypothetical protein